MNASSTSLWHMLGDLSLPVGASPNEIISAWLIELLAPLHLHENFLNRVIKSVQDYAGRALNQDAGVPFGHIHLSIFGPNERTSKGQTWGFFRIEKIDSAEHNAAHPDHTVEFYLYQESS
ncbi:MAG TPA: hypothetical protein VFY66_13500 [Anaerolineales bacterium]|nr:hypothetical protein [Anaerolineales bacterium]